MVVVVSVVVGLVCLVYVPLDVVVKGSVVVVVVVDVVVSAEVDVVVVKFGKIWTKGHLLRRKKC